MSDPRHSRVLVAGLDIGTTSVSGVAVAPGGEIEAIATVAHEAAVSGLPAGHAEQSAQRLRGAAFRCLREISGEGRGHRIRAVGLTGQMHSTVFLNAQNQAVGNVITWQDRRSVSGAAPAPLQQLLQRVSAESLSCPGCRPAAGYLGATAFTLRIQNQWPTDCVRVTFVAPWIAGELTGQTPVCDRSHAASSGLYDVVHGQWKTDVVQAAMLTPEQLPTVADSGAAVSPISATAAVETGLPETVLICNAIGDNQASVIAALPDTAGAVLVNIGTGGQIVWRSGPVAFAEQMEIRPLPGDGTGDSEIIERWMTVGAGLCGGDALAWWNQTVRRWLSEFGLQLSDDQVWDHYRQHSGADGSAEGLNCTPFFRGTRFEPHRRGVLEGIDWTNLGPVTLLHSIYDGIARVMRDVYQSAQKDSAVLPPEVWMAGNGARRNPGLVRAVERFFGRPVHLSRFREEAAVGAALLAGVRTGVWLHLELARELVRGAARELDL